jgi:hypothetical protein
VAGSYRDIDYRIRPAKYAERVMIGDALQRLKFGTIESYQYVGLGSVYFSDFVLFHRRLGIQKMVSIERETQDAQRFLDNLPYSNIEMLWGSTTTELTKIDLSLRSIVWLDFEDPLNRAMLDDVRSVISRAVSGTAILVTTQCKPALQDSDNPRKIVELLAEQLGRERVDVSLSDNDLLGWGTAAIYRRIVINDVRATLAQRNGTRPPEQHIEFEQILNFHYKDGVQMQTIGGVLFDRGQRPIFNQCAFSELEFFRPGESAFRIDVPKLTTRELRLLEAQLPLAEDAAISPGSMPVRDAEWFRKIYRYFPNFGVVET